MSADTLVSFLLLVIEAYGSQCHQLKKYLLKNN